MKASVAGHWAALDDHFQHHVRLVDRFSDADAEAVVRMWLSEINEHGDCLSQFEREALVERYCELFETWPQ